MFVVLVERNARQSYSVKRRRRQRRSMVLVVLMVWMLMRSMRTTLRVLEGLCVSTATALPLLVSWGAPFVRSVV